MSCAINVLTADHPHLVIYLDAGAADRVYRSAYAATLVWNADFNVR